MARTSLAEAVTRIAFYAGWLSAMGAVMRPKGIVETETESGPGSRAKPPAPSGPCGAEQQGDARWRFCRGGRPGRRPRRTWGEHVIPIPGTKTPKYLADNAGAGDVELSPADPADLDALPATEGGRY